MKNQRLNELRRQEAFIDALWSRLRTDLNDSIKECEKSRLDYYWINGHTRIADDARRVRRELLTLVKMLEET